MRVTVTIQVENVAPQDGPEARAEVIQRIEEAFRHSAQGIGRVEYIHVHFWTALPRSE
jgi:hypothetical protein